MIAHLTGEVQTFHVGCIVVHVLLMFKLWWLCVIQGCTMIGQVVGPCVLVFGNCGS